MVQDNKTLNDIFSFNGPLSTFSSRLNLAFSLGLISRIVRDDLNTIRKIRNEFGHNPDYIDFNVDKIKSLCNNLRWTFPKEIPPRIKFVNCVHGILGLIKKALNENQQIKEKENEDLEKMQREMESLIVKVAKAKQKK